jgi:hypothetical protein
MGGVDTRDVLEGIGSFFADRPTRAAIVARRLLGRPDPGDGELSEHLIREIRRKTRIDGSMGGVLADTSWSAWELMELGCFTDCAGLVRMLGYVLAQQDKPGHFGEGCSPDAHARRHCHHFLSGFFSPGGRDEEIAPLHLPCGAVFTDEDEARLAVSLFTLRTVLRAGEDRRQSVRDHVTALLQSDLAAHAWSAEGKPDLFFLMAGAIAYGAPEHRDELQPALQALVEHQDNDGSWPNAHFFLSLDMLSGMTGPKAGLVLQRAVQRLPTLQRPDGAFGEDPDEEWTLIATRALLASRS